MMIYCCGCKKKINARLTYGAEVYPRSPKLQSTPFWKCDNCGNHVGCHHKTKNPTKPLGAIATPEIKKARQHIHSLIDPIWKVGKMTRSKVYSYIAKGMGWKSYHTAEIKNIEDARRVYRIGLNLLEDLKNE